MKIIQPLLITIILIAISCNKDKFTTVPQVSIKSISPATVYSGDIINLRGNYTDKEGDLDSALIVYKWYNGATVVKKDTFRFSFTSLHMPPQTKDAEISVDFQYNTTNPNGFVTLPGVFPKDTTATLGLILIDAAKNRSNYAESNQIRLKKP
jgi:hypothetical protein